MTGIIMTKENVKTDKSTMKRMTDTQNSEDPMARIWVHKVVKEEVKKMVIRVSKEDSPAHDLLKTSKVLEEEHRVPKMIRQGNKME